MVTVSLSARNRNEEAWARGEGRKGRRRDVNNVAGEGDRHIDSFNTVTLGFQMSSFLREKIDLDSENLHHY